MNFIALPKRPLFGCIHHASHLKQSPPLEGEAFRKFMRGEMAAMRDAGFNSYVLECSWVDLEWKRDEFDFGYVDVQLELCRELGLVPHLWLFAELTPKWFRDAHPEAMCIAASGRVGMSHSLAHPLARERMDLYLRTCVKRYGAEVACANVGIESGLHWVKGPDSNDYDDSLYDYNPAAVARFREWLRARHASLAEFGRLCRERFPSWESVDAPTRRPFRTNPMLENQVLWLEWRRFTIDLFADYLGAKASAVRAISPSLPVSDQTYEVDPARGAQDIRLINTHMDVGGTSFFVSNAPGDYPIGNYLLDYHRSGAGGRPFWIWELRSGQNAWGITNWGPPVDASDLARFTWQVIAAGAKTVQYWNWRPHLGGLEVGGHGMAERDGSGNERTRRMGALARKLDAHAEWFMDLKPASAQIAIFDCRDGRIVAAGESNDRLLVEAQQGAHAALDANGFPVDFVSEREIETGSLARYRMLVLPCAYVLGASAARAIASWVESGGTLVAGVFCAAKDEFGFAPTAVPGHGLDAVFGAREGTIVPLFDAADTQVSQFGEAWDVVIRGRRPVVWKNGETAPLELYRYRASLNPLKATVQAEHEGTPVLTRNASGRGLAYLFGSLPVPKDFLNPAGIGDWLARVAKEAGVAAPVEIRKRAGTPIYAKRMKSKSGEDLLVLLSASEKSETVSLAFDSPTTHACEFESGRTLEFDRSEAGRRELTVILGPRDALALRLQTR